ncbi:unnamed protein product [Rangifer tarandus platyrhynchus]|uniref:Uncharacterized protein n=1 Tax=Rangifer tarandus platyrhynchus TaxID=3082113 RepID=A0AC59ZCA9_RANTA
MQERKAGVSRSGSPALPCCPVPSHCRKSKREMTVLLAKDPPTHHVRHRASCSCDFLSPQDHPCGIPNSVIIPMKYGSVPGAWPMKGEKGWKWN